MFVLSSQLFSLLEQFHHYMIIVNDLAFLQNLKMLNLKPFQFFDF